MQVIEDEQHRSRGCVARKALLDEGEERAYVLGRLVVPQADLVERQSLSAVKGLEKRLEGHETAFGGAAVEGRSSGAGDLGGKPGREACLSDPGLADHEHDLRALSCTSA